MSDLDLEERAAIEARHQLVPASVWDIPPSGGADDYRCVTCGGRTCDAARLLVALTAAEARVERLTDALTGMVTQFAYWSTGSGGGCHTGGLSALEDAFDVLGWDDPHPAPEARCDEPGCMKQASCGTPSPTGYRRTCWDHRPDGGRQP